MMVSDTWILPLHGNDAFLLEYIGGFSGNLFGIGIAMGVMFYTLFNLLRP